MSLVLTVPCHLKTPTIVEKNSSKAWFVLLSFDIRTRRPVALWRHLWRNPQWKNQYRYREGWCSGWTGTWWLVGSRVYADFHEHRLDLRTDQMKWYIEDCKMWRGCIAKKMLVNEDPDDYIVINCSHVVHSLSHWQDTLPMSLVFTVPCHLKTPTIVS